jgi:DNA polymerase-3 subunit epsilon
VNFVVIDVETANSDLSSICQVGIASFRDGVLHNSWESLVNPEDEFDPICVAIHGIDAEKVRSSPSWAAVYSEVSPLLQGNRVACHTAFDRVALLRACEKKNLAQCECRWLDSAMVVRRAWPIFSRSGYGLTNVATEFGIKYRPHDALEDARCAGEVLLRAIAETGLGIDQWLERVKQPINLPVRQPSVRQLSDPLVRQPIHPSTALPITRHGNPDGPLYGEVLVFTGALSMPRHEAADAAAGAGCEVATSVTKHTTLLVVGNQDVRKLAGQERSLKHRKAEELINEGQKIRIISESDFQRIAEQQTMRLNGLG